MRATTIGLLAVCLAGCTTQAPRPKGPVVGVEPFTIDRPDPNEAAKSAAIANQAAAWLIGALREEGVEAYIVPEGQPGYGDVRISGAITELEFARDDRFGILLTIRDSAGHELAEVAAGRSSLRGMERAMKVTILEDVMHSQQFRHAVFAMPAGIAAKP